MSEYQDSDARNKLNILQWRLKTTMFSIATLIVEKNLVVVEKIVFENRDKSKNIIV